MSAEPTVAAALAAVRERIARACSRAGRRPEDVTLVGIGKGQPVDKLREAWQAGLRVFGENRVQEARDKAPQMPAEVEWHLVGPLQTNKARLAVQIFRVFHAIDREKLARALDAEARARGERLPVFLEINLGGEASKHGFAPGELAAQARPLAGLTGLRVVGLMAIPPQGADPEAARPWFRRLRELRDELGRLPEWSGWPGCLSMGMSGDFEVAIEEGSTHVRVGTAIFGERP